MTRTASAAAPARERILEAAERLFCSQGLRVGVDEVVRASGVAKMTLYKHFESKDALVAAVVRRKDEAFTAWFAAQLESLGPDPLTRLLGCFDVLETWVSSNEFRGCPFLNVASEICDPKHPARLAAMDHKRAMLDALAALCRQVGAPDADELARQWLLLMDGAVVQSHMWGSGDPIRRAKDAARALLDR